MLIARLLAQVMLILLLLHDVLLAGVLLLPGSASSTYAILAWAPLALAIWLFGMIALYASGERDSEAWFALAIPVLVLIGPLSSPAVPVETSLLMLAAWGIGLNLPVLIVCQRILFQEQALAYAPSLDR